MIGQVPPAQAQPTPQSTNPQRLCYAQLADYQRNSIFLRLPLKLERIVEALRAYQFKLGKPVPVTLEQIEHRTGLAASAARQKPQAEQAAQKAQKAKKAQNPQAELTQAPSSSFQSSSQASSQSSASTSSQASFQPAHPVRKYSTPFVKRAGVFYYSFADTGTNQLDYALVDAHSADLIKHIGELEAANLGLIPVLTSSELSALVKHLRVSQGAREQVLAQDLALAQYQALTANLVQTSEQAGALKQALVALLTHYYQEQAHVEFAEEIAAYLAAEADATAYPDQIIAFSDGRQRQLSQTTYAQWQAQRQEIMHAPKPKAKLNVVLYQPMYSGNVGNIIRLCANFDVSLHVIFPVMFPLDDASLRRAGLDYREFVNLVAYPSWENFKQVQLDSSQARCFALTTKGTKSYTEIEVKQGDFLVFGSEKYGLPEAVRQDIAQRGQLVKIPMHPDSRSLNVSNSVAIMVAEAMRQLDFPDLKI